MLLAVSALETANSQRCVHDYMPWVRLPGSTNRLAINQGRLHWESGKEATLCHSNPQKHEESCLTGTLVLEGVVTYMSRVEAFVTGIKMESSDQSPFWGSIKGSRTDKINGSRTHGCNLTFDPLKIKRSRASEGNNQAIKHTFCRSKALIPVANAWIGGM